MTPAASAAEQHSTGRGGTWLLNAATVFCLLFGVALILQVQVAGDGMWFWYAKLLLAGRHLYGDLHLALQPLFVLVTAANMRLFGEGWLVSKLPASVLLAVYVLVLRAIAGALPLRDGPRAVLLLAAFSFPLLFEADRFDDYHVMADCFQVSSLLVLLRLERQVTATAVLSRAAWLGVLSGLAMMSRLNDGGLLWATVLLALLWLAPMGKAASGLLFTVVTAVTVVLTVFATGDTLAAYATNSIARAAGAKGGSGKLLLYPVHLLQETSTHFVQQDRFLLLLALALTFAVGVAWVARRKALNASGARVHAGTAVLVLALLAYLPLLRAHRWAIVTLPRMVCATMILAGFALGAATLVRGLRAGMQARRHDAGWNPAEALLLIPLGQLVSGSLSSGGEYLPLNAPVGILLLLLPFAYPAFFRRPNRTYGYAAVVGLASFCCLAYKAAVPFAWQTYHTAPLFTGRQWYRHPVYGPMILETDLLEFMQPMCDRVHGAADPSMLSLPFPYPNYFCNVAPWNDEVQTFFDTSTGQSIAELDHALETAPPHTIAYQRQVLNLLSHERLYTQYKPLPQRAVDRLLVSKLTTGAWSLAHQQCVAESDWLLIETVPRASQPPGRALPFNPDPYRCVGRNLVDALEAGRPGQRLGRKPGQESDREDTMRP